MQRCGGCRERAQMLGRSFDAARRGDGRTAMRELAAVGRSAGQDIRAATARARDQAAARLRGRSPSRG